jgi:hypothetical protein
MASVIRPWFQYGSASQKPRLPFALSALWAEMNVADRLAVTGPQRQNPLIDFFAGGDLFELEFDEGFGAVIRIRPGHDACEMSDDVPVVEMALNVRRVGKRQRPQHQPLCLQGRRRYFWHFGHQNVERPFWTKRRTMPPQPAVWQVSPSRS